MTQFKVGDRVKLVKEFGGWCGCNLGKEGVIISENNEAYEWERVKFDNSVGDVFETDCGNQSHLELVTTTPPPQSSTKATTTHAGSLLFLSGLRMGLGLFIRRRGKLER